MKGRGNLSLQFVKGPIGLIGAFYGSENDKKTSWFSELFIFKRQFSQSDFSCPVKQILTSEK